MPASIFAPDTSKLVEDDAVPVIVLRAEGAPLGEMVGVTAVKVADAADAGAKFPAKSEAVPATIEIPNVPAPVMPEMVTVYDVLVFSVKPTVPPAVPVALSVMLPGTKVLVLKLASA